MVLFGLTVIVFNSTKSNTAVSLLILSFLVPAVLFSAVAGVYVDRIDRRLILIATNLLRGAAFVALYLVGSNLALILLLNVAVSTITVFFAPAELAMIPVLVPRQPAAGGERDLHPDPERRVRARVRAARPAGGQGGRRRRRSSWSSPRCTSWPRCSASRCRRRRRHRPRRRTPHSGLGVGEAERAVGTTLAQLREGFTFIRVQPDDQLVADLPRDHRVAGRRARRARSGVRPADARAQGRGLRGGRPAARVRDRDRHPAAQLVRPLLRRAGGSSRAA